MIERAIVDAAAALRRSGEPYVLATAICQRGSAYRRAGARLILAGDRRVAGAISGGCLEGDLATRAWWRTRGRDAVVLTYDSRHDDDADDDDVRAAFAVGCNGVVDVLLERVDDRDGRAARIDPLAVAARCIARQRRGALATIYRGTSATTAIGARLAIIEGEPLAADPAFPADAQCRRAIRAELDAAIAHGAASNRVYDLPDGAIEVFVEPLLPPPRLFAFGGGPDVVPVIALARALGWDALACVPHVRPSVRERLIGADDVLAGSPAVLVAHVDAADRAVAVVMAHDYELDRAHLAALLGSHARYLGVLGPRKRTDRMLADLDRAADRDDVRLHAPIGLELGAETPQEIALAITGEIQAVLAGVPHRGLRDRTGPIHERAESPSLARDTDAASSELGERLACAAAGA